MKNLALVALTLTAGVAFAGTWTEVGDAPDLLPAQEVVGSGPLDLIVGSVFDLGDADLFEICVTDYANFSASTVGLSDLDTRLYLFDPSTGNGISMNDDDAVSGGYQSTVTGQFLTGNGCYVLGISEYGVDPMNPSGALIWEESPYDVERQPDGPGAPGPLAGWDDYWAWEAGNYSIALTGAAFIPEPASLGLLIVGGLTLLRRR